MQMSADWYHSPSARAWVDDSPAAPAGQFHRSMPGYAPTALHDLPHLAQELGVASVRVKDESARLGLPAFKILGASWACANVVAERTGTAPDDLPSLRRSAEGRSIEFVTATDGNHGRAVARMAALFGLTSTVFVPATMTPAAAEAIAAEGGSVHRSPGDYDQAVTEAAQYADRGGERALVQDTAWEGYEQVPAWIVQGYETLLAEIDQALPDPPDLVVVPVGVGSLAQAVVSHYRRGPGSRPSALLAVEPRTAACALASLTTGEPVTVPIEGSVMAGLNCGTVSAGAWPVLRDGLDGAITVGDEQALRAAEDLNRAGVSSGPSGAATLAGLRAALTVPARREALGVTGASTVVLLNTEGRRETSPPAGTPARP